MKEEEIDKNESIVPTMSGDVFHKAREEAIAAGFSVLEAENGCIYKVLPNNKKELIRRIAQPVKVKEKKIIIR